ncbi:MAG: hypothetical protein ACYTAF_04700, partial [Planctomycetota bacterium]
MTDTEGPFRTRIRRFLEYVRPKLHLTPREIERVDKLRRASDIRIREARVKSPLMSAYDVGTLATPPKSAVRFDMLAYKGGLFDLDDLRTKRDPLSDQMAMFREASILAQVVPPEH